MSVVRHLLVIVFLTVITMCLDSPFGITKPAPPRPQIVITKAYPKKFSIPYGYGLGIEYYFDLKIQDAPWRKAVSITTQYSPDGGLTWYTDEVARSPSYRWDNIHGDITCGPTIYNLKSDHTYALRVILNWNDGGVIHQTYSNTARATVEDYAELCIEEQLAEKFKPVLHRHPYDAQPEGLINVDTVRWASRKVVNIRGQTYPDSGITKHSPFHWNSSYHWDTWGYGQTWVQFRWDMDDTERYKEEVPGERPLYYHVYKDGPYYYVQYWYFMTMNDIKEQTNESTWHEGDFEHITIEVEKVGNTFIPRRVNFYKHEGGRQFPASECWWSTDAEGPGMKIPPKKGYDEFHTHLHVWIARNSHASYNFDEPLYELNVAGDVYTEEVDYDPNSWTRLYETFFRYDYLINMGEIKRSPDTDGDSYINAHGWEWFDHWYHVPAWHDLQWLPFRGRLGTYWCKKPDGTVATWVLLFYPKSICTPSPPSPAWGLDWVTFTDNVDCAGFGNRDGGAKDYKWRDPYTGEVVCNP